MPQIVLKSVPSHAVQNNQTPDDLLMWINKLLGEKHKSVAELMTGVSYCITLHILCPNALPMHKMILKPETEGECLTNFDEFESALKRAGIYKAIDRYRLVQGHNQSHIRLLQWLQSLYSINKSSEAEEENLPYTKSEVMKKDEYVDAEVQIGNAAALVKIENAAACQTDDVLEEQLKTGKAAASATELPKKLCELDESALMQQAAAMKTALNLPKFSLTPEYVQSIIDRSERTKLNVPLEELKEMELQYIEKLNTVFRAQNLQFQKLLSAEKIVQESPKDNENIKDVLACRLLLDVIRKKIYSTKDTDKSASPNK